MTLKTHLGGAISMLAVTLIAMPVMAASKAKTKTKNIECKVIVEDGDVTIEKIVNGKTIKTDDEDKDCSVMVNDAFTWKGGENNVIMERLDGADGEINVTVMDMEDGPGKQRVFIKQGRHSGGMGGLHKWTGEMEIEGMPFGHGMMSMGNGLPFMFRQDNQEELDLDKDGKITQAEARKARNTKLKSYDSNRDGQLSLDEYQAYWAAKRHGQMVDAFQELDEDGDAKVTAEEFAAPAVKRAKMQTRILHMAEEHKNKGSKSKGKKRKRK